jgi:hypothetical protein
MQPRMWAGRWAVGRSASPTAPTYEMEGRRPTQEAETLERGWAPGGGKMMALHVGPRVMQ